MKKFDFSRIKRSPLPGKKTSEATKPQADVDDGISDYTDSEPGGSTADFDSHDGFRSVTPDPSKTREQIDTYRRKIDKVRMEIQKEQIIKEDHVKEYLDLSSRASPDDGKVKNIKLLFEKKNSESAQKIAILQKKLERYQSEHKRVEQHGASSHRAAKEVLKDVGQGIKDFGGSVVGNIRTATDVFVSKPKDTLGTLSVGSGKSKSGSVDNINSIANSTSNNEQLPQRASDSPVSPTGSTTLPANFKLHVPVGEQESEVVYVGEMGSVSEASYHIARDSPQTSSTSPQLQTISQSAIEPLLQKLNSNADSLERVTREIDMLRSQMNDFHEEIGIVRTCVEDERAADRYDRLEEHLNDFVELTQNELSNLKQEMSNMEEKIDYQLEERTRDLHEALENANTRITKMELQNQHQQLISMEGMDNANAKMLLTKLINVLLAFLAVVLVFLSTVSNIFGPLLNARWKVVTVMVFIFAIIFMSSRWSSGGGMIISETTGQQTTVK